MNVLMSTIGSRTARPPPSRARTIRLRRRRGGVAPAAAPAARGMLITVIGQLPTRTPSQRCWTRSHGMPVTLGL